MKQNLTSLDNGFKKGSKKMLKVLGKIINRNVDHCNKELKMIKMNQSKIDNLTVKIKTSLEASRSNGHQDK